MLKNNIPQESGIVHNERNRLSPIIRINFVFSTVMFVASMGSLSPLYIQNTAACKAFSGSDRRQRRTATMSGTVIIDIKVERNTVRAASFSSLP